MCHYVKCTRPDGRKWREKGIWNNTRCDTCKVIPSCKIEQWWDTVMRYSINVWDLGWVERRTTWGGPLWQRRFIYLDPSCLFFSTTRGDTTSYFCIESFESLVNILKWGPTLRWCVVSCKSERGGSTWWRWVPKEQEKWEVVRIWEGT